jgi:hypothetical protein
VTLRQALLSGVLLAMTVVGTVPTGSVHAAPEPQWADYYGKQINLAESWENAQACLLSASGNECFDTEAELDELIAERAEARSSSLLIDCSSTVRLYANTNYGTLMVAIDDRFTTTSLGSFANMTSSYRVGACSSTFYNGSSPYPGSTVANASAASMLPGWDNTIDSVYIS